MKVSVSAIRGNLRIRWGYRKKPYTLTPGLTDTKQNRAYCEAIANKILADCLTGNFDDTLYRYKPWMIGHEHKEVTCAELFQKFTIAMKQEKGLYPGSLRRYQGALSHLKKRLNIQAHLVTEAKTQNFSAQMAEHVSNRTLKEYLQLYRACFNWADKKYVIPDVNPWDAPLKRVNPHVKPRIQPFTEEEVRAIIRSFQSNHYYSFYRDFVAFLFGTGCRLGEAIALQWNNIDPDFKSVWISEAFSDGQRKSTKNGKSRTVQLSQTIREMLKSRHTMMKPHGNELVFPAKSGGHINLRNFRRRAWTIVLSECRLFYRKPYITRHTAISHALANGADPVHVSDQTGHNLKTLLEHYVHVIRPRAVFVEF